MSNGDTHWEDAPASEGETRARDLASVVERALAVLREHGTRAPALRAPRRLDFDPTTVPVVGELHKELERLRNEAQDLVDELVRVVESMASGVVAEARPVEAAAASPSSDMGELPGLPLLRRLVALPGQASSTELRLVNDMRHPVDVLMKATSLIGPKGFEIPGHHVGFTPNPLTMGPSAVRPVGVTVRVPDRVPPGEYSGLVQGVGLDGAHARLTVEVRPAANGG